MKEIIVVMSRVPLRGPAHVTMLSAVVALAVVGNVSCFRTSSRNAGIVEQLNQLGLPGKSSLCQESPFGIAYFSQEVFGDEDLALLANTAGDRLQVLYFTNSSITDQGLQYLSNVTSLRAVALDSAAVSDQGLQYLVRSRELDSLVLSGTNATGHGLDRFTKLQQLSLQGCPVDDEGLRHIGQLDELRLLNLVGTKVTANGLQHLHGLRNLHTLGLGGTAVTSDDVKRLVEAMPQLMDVDTLDYSRITATERGN